MLKRVVLTDLRIGAPRDLVPEIEKAAFEVSAEILKHLDLTNLDSKVGGALDPRERAKLIADGLCNNPLMSATFPHFGASSPEERVSDLLDTATVLRLESRVSSARKG